MTPSILLLCGPTDVGKSFVSEVVVGLEYHTTTEKLDSIYRRALGACGIEKPRIRQQAEMLRDGRHPKEIRDAFWVEWEALIRAHLQSAVEWGVTPVFEGYTIGLADEAERIARVAEDVYGEPVRITRILLRPSLDDWNRNHARRIWQTKPSTPVEPWGPDVYARELADLEPVDGIADHVAPTPKAVRQILDAKTKIRPYKWYQRLAAGPIRLNGASDSREKAAVFAPEHVVGKSVLDVCCATGIVSMLVKDRAADRVAGVEFNPATHARSLELRKALLRHTRVDAKVELRLGDARKLVPKLGTFDTVFMFGALHYFEEFEAMLTMLAEAASETVYVEFLLPEFSGRTWNGEPGVQAYERRTGTVVYAADAASLLEITARAMPEFDLTDRQPTSGVGRGVDAYREVWTFVKR